MALLAGTILRGDRYQVRKLLARGGFGFIYLVHDHSTDRDIVLKELMPALVRDPEMLRRFEREGRALQRLDHPNIIRADAMFQDQGNAYLALEYTGDQVLSDWTDRGHKFSLSEVGRVAGALCDALAYLHKRGIVHCDLNPSNVVLDPDGNPKLIDLGIAHIPDRLVHRRWHTERDLPMGTVLYMSPEQIDGVRDDPRVDLYALGVILYQMLAGRHYLDFNLENTQGAYADNIGLVRDATPRPLPDAPPEVERVIMRALAKDPDERYPDVTTFGYRLKQALFPHLPPEQGIRLVVPFQGAGEREARQSDNGEWPSWLWKLLLAVNIAVMIAVALLLIRHG